MTPESHEAHDRPNSAEEFGMGMSTTPRAEQPPADAGPDPALDLVLFQNLLSGSPDLLYFKDRDGRYLRLSRGAEAALAGSEDAPVGTSALDHDREAQATLASEDEQQIIRTGEPLLDVVEHRRRPDRPDAWVSTSKLPLLGDDGEVVGVFGISRDITARVLAEREAQRAVAELTTILESSPDAVVRVDTDLRLTYLNPAALALAAGSLEDLLGQPVNVLDGPVPALGPWESALGEVLRTGEATEAAFWLASHGEQVWFHARLVPQRDAEGAVVGVISTARDVTALMRAEQVLEHQASHDPLTGLANRVLLLERLGQALGRLGGTPGVLALLLIDLDGFHEINALRGHAAGDLVLIETARRLSATARGVDTVARVGGDQFVLVCENLTALADADRVAQRLREVLSRPYRAAPGTAVTASVGVAVVADGTQTAEETLRIADKEMSRSKEAGRAARLRRSRPGGGQEAGTDTPPAGLPTQRRRDQP